VSVKICDGCLLSMQSKGWRCMPCIKCANERLKFFCENLLEQEKSSKAEIHFLGLPKVSILF